jgi:hypothetical protein
MYLNMQLIKILGIFVLPTLSSGCLGDNRFGYDYSIKLKNNSTDSIYVDYELNYPDPSNKSKFVRYSTKANGLLEFGTLGKWNKYFTKVSDTLFVYVISKEVHKSFSFDSIFINKKFLARKSISYTQFYNGEKSVFYP